MNKRCADYFDLKNELERYEREGIKISMEGKKVLPRHAAQICCFENSSEIMRDYVIDDKGKIIEIGFNRINQY